MKTALVTGGAGFIGSHLCEKLLELDYRVINFDNFNDFYDPSLKRANVKKSLSNPNYLSVEGDIRDYDLLDRVFKENAVDLVIHLAAVAGVRKSLEYPAEYADVDIIGTINLLELAKKYRTKKFIFASSSSVYGTNPVPFSEDACIGLQLSPYAASKHAGEQFCRTYSHLYRLPVVVLRFFTVYGPRQRPEMAVHSFTRCIDQGREIHIFGDGKASRDYTYIDDIIQGILCSMDYPCDFEIFNLGNSKPVKLNELIGIIESKLGKYALKRFQPMQPGDVESTCADISKAKRLLGYSPKTGINKGIEKFLKWYKTREQPNYGTI